MTQFLLSHKVVITYTSGSQPVSQSPFEGHVPLTCASWDYPTYQIFTLCSKITVVK